MSQRGKRSNRHENDSQHPPQKRRKGRPPNSSTIITDPDHEIMAKSSVSIVSASGTQTGSNSSNTGNPSTSTLWQARSLSDLKISSIYNRSSSEAPAELFRKDLISAMKLPDSEPLSTDEYWTITDQWKQEWEKGVQVPVNPDSLPEPSVKPMQQSVVTIRNDFKIPKNKYVRITKDDNFSTELYCLSNVPSLAETACAYDLDQTDEVWIKLINEERALCGLPSITEGQFERVVEELEIRCWDKIQAIMKSEEGLGIEYDENVICDVCRSPDSEEANEMVFCDNCNICVHQACYGITAIPSGQWLCRTCSMGKKPDCALCPNKGGAMKSTKSGKKWAHVSCALWIPEVSIGCVDRMEPITKISSIPQSRWALICVLCRERVGACIQCSVKTCKTAYHVTCAFQHGLEMRAIIEEGNAEDGVKLRSYCLKHSVSKGKKDKSASNQGVASGSEDEDVRKRKIRKDMTSEERNQVRAIRLQEVESEFDKHVNVKDISCHLLEVDQEAIISIYNYWILKRKSRNNHALIPPKAEEVDVLSSKQEQADLEKRKMVVHLRQDLERVRNLCYMVNRREKLSRSFFKMREQIFYKQIAVLNEYCSNNMKNNNSSSNINKSSGGTSTSSNNLNSNNNSNRDEEFLNAVIHANNGPSIYDKFYSSENFSSGDCSINFEMIQEKIKGNSSSTNNNNNNSNKNSSGNCSGNNNINNNNNNNNTSCSQKLEVGNKNRSSSNSNTITTTTTTMTSVTATTITTTTTGINTSSSCTVGTKKYSKSFKKIHMNGISDRKGNSVYDDSHSLSTNSDADIDSDRGELKQKHPQQQQSQLKQQQQLKNSSSISVSKKRTQSYSKTSAEKQRQRRKSTASVAPSQPPPRVDSSSSSSSSNSSTSESSSGSSSSGSSSGGSSTSSASSSEDEANDNDGRSSVISIRKEKRNAERQKNHSSLHQMEKELAKETANMSSSGNESDELILIKNNTSNKTTNKKPTVPIYSDSSDNSDKEEEDNRTAVSDSQHQMFRTKAAMKEFTLQQSNKTKQDIRRMSSSLSPIKSNKDPAAALVKQSKNITPSSKSSSIEKLQSSPESKAAKISKDKEKAENKKNTKQQQSDQDQHSIATKATKKDERKQKTQKQQQAQQQQLQQQQQQNENNFPLNLESKRFPTDLLVVPQRQAAKKASENMRSTTYTVNTGQKKETVSSKVDEKDILPTVKEKDHSASSSSSSSSSNNNSSRYKDRDKEKEKESREEDKDKEKDKEDKKVEQNREKEHRDKEKSKPRGRPPKISKDELKESLSKDTNNQKQRNADAPAKSTTSTPINAAVISSTNSKPITESPGREGHSTTSAIGTTTTTTTTTTSSSSWKNKNIDNNLLVAYVPQRQAAKKAAEHIKSGLGKSVVPETSASPEDKDKDNKTADKDNVDRIQQEKDRKTSIDNKSIKEKTKTKTQDTTTTTTSKDIKSGKKEKQIVLSSSSSESSSYTSSTSSSSEEDEEESEVEEATIKNKKKNRRDSDKFDTNSTKTKISSNTSGSSNKIKELSDKNSSQIKEKTTDKLETSAINNDEKIVNKRRRQSKEKLPKQIIDVDDEVEIIKKNLQKSPIETRNENRISHYSENKDITQTIDEDKKSVQEKEQEIEQQSKTLEEEIAQRKADLVSSTATVTTTTSTVSNVSATQQSNKSVTRNSYSLDRLLDKKEKEQKIQEFIEKPFEELRPPSCGIVSESIDDNELEHPSKRLKEDLHYEQEQGQQLQENEKIVDESNIKSTLPLPSPHEAIPNVISIDSESIENIKTNNNNNNNHNLDIRLTPKDTLLREEIQNQQQQQQQSYQMSPFKVNQSPAIIENEINDFSNSLKKREDDNMIAFDVSNQQKDSFHAVSTPTQPTPSSMECDKTFDNSNINNNALEIEQQQFHDDLQKSSIHCDFSATTTPIASSLFDETKQNEEDSARETMNLVEKLRQKYKRSTSTTTNNFNKSTSDEAINNSSVVPNENKVQQHQQQPSPSVTQTAATPLISPNLTAQAVAPLLPSPISSQSQLQSQISLSPSSAAQLPICTPETKKDLMYNSSPKDIFQQQQQQQPQQKQQPQQQQQQQQILDNVDKLTKERISPRTLSKENITPTTLATSTPPDAAITSQNEILNVPPSSNDGNVVDVANHIMSPFDERNLWLDKSNITRHITSHQSYQDTKRHHQQSQQQQQQQQPYQQEPQQQHHHHHQTNRFLSPSNKFENCKLNQFQKQQTDCFDSIAAAASNFFKNDFVDMANVAAAAAAVIGGKNNMEINAHLTPTVNSNEQTKLDSEYDDNSRMQSPYMHPNHIWNENELIQTRRSVSSSPSSISESNDEFNKHNKVIGGNKSSAAIALDDKSVQQSMSLSQQPPPPPTSHLTAMQCNNMSLQKNNFGNMQSFNMPPSMSAASASQFQLQQQQQQPQPPQHHHQQHPVSLANGVDMLSSYNFHQQTDNSQYNGPVSLFPPPQQQQHSVPNLNVQMPYPSPGAALYPPPPSALGGTTNSVPLTQTSQSAAATNSLYSPHIPKHNQDNTSPYSSLMGQPPQSCVATATGGGSGVAFTSSHNLALTAAIVSTSVQQLSTMPPMSSPQIIQQHHNSYNMGQPPPPAPPTNLVTGTNQMISCDPLTNSVTKDSPSKRSSSRYNQQQSQQQQPQITSPKMHKSPGKSPRQMELMNKQNVQMNSSQKSTKCDNSRQKPRAPRGSNGTANRTTRGRGRGRGRILPIAQIPSSIDFDNPLGSITNNLAGTVYDLDFDDDFSATCNVENLKSLRDRRRSFDCRVNVSVQNSANVVGVGQPKFSSPTYHQNKLRNSLTSTTTSSTSPSNSAVRGLLDLKPPSVHENESTIHSSHSLLHNIVHPVLPGPVDMRTYSSGYENQSSTTASQDAYNSHLLGAFASGTADQPLHEIDEEAEKEFQSALKATGTQGVKSSTSTTISNTIATSATSITASSELQSISTEAQVLIETTSEEISIDSDTTTTKVSLSDSRNQLKLKIKGPLAHPDIYNSSSSSNNINQTMSSQNSGQMPSVSQGSTGNTSSGTSSLRRMRKKELLRQYWTQDMNMDDSACLPPVENKTDNDQSIGRSIVGIPKAVDSLSSIPTKEDYIDYTSMDPRKRKKFSGIARELRQLDMPYDTDRTERRRSACSTGSNISANNINDNGSSVSSKRRGKSKSNELFNNSSGNESGPALKIKIRNNVVEPSIDTGRRAMGYPPKKRLTNMSTVPSFELLKRDCMNFRKQVMADFDEEEKVEKVKVKIKKDHHKSSHKKKKKEKHDDTDNDDKHQEVQVIENPTADAPKIIIRIGKRKAQDDLLQQSQQQHTTEDIELATPASKKVPTETNVTAGSNEKSSKKNHQNSKLKRSTTEKSIIPKIRLKIARTSDGDNYVIGAGTSSTSGTNKGNSTKNSNEILKGKNFETITIPVENVKLPNNDELISTQAEEDPLSLDNDSFMQQQKVTNLQIPTNNDELSMTIASESTATTDPISSQQQNSSLSSLLSSTTTTTTSASTSSNDLKDQNNKSSSKGCPLLPLNKDCEVR